MCMTRMAHPAFRPNPPALVGPLIIASGALYGLLVRCEPPSSICFGMLKAHRMVRRWRPWKAICVCATLCKK